MQLTKTSLLIITIFLSVHTRVDSQSGSVASFRDPVIKKGDKKSLVQRTESAVLIPGNTHEDLWIAPTIVTVPGNPIIFEMSLISTDRRGKDQVNDRHFYKTDDYFKTLITIEQPFAKAWKRIGLSVNDLDPPENKELQIPESLEHTGYMAYLNLGGDIILQAFTTRDEGRFSVQSLIAQTKNDRYIPLHISNSWTNSKGRGLYEPQIAEYNGKFYMTARAEDGCGYLLVSSDNGISWEPPVPWKWDNDEIIPMSQTMTKLLSHSDGLVLVYTRICDDNSNVFRNRAPLFIADFDTESLSLKRSTELIIVPNKGLPVGNFWVWPVNQDESYVVTAEWPRDGREENGDVWLVKVKWRKPNMGMTEEGVEMNIK